MTLWNLVNKVKSKRPGFGVISYRIKQNMQAIEFGLKNYSEILAQRDIHLSPLDGVGLPS